MINVAKIIPCPYCGSTELDIDTYRTRLWLDKFHARVECKNCLAKGPPVTTGSRGHYTTDEDYPDVIEECIKLYNTRK